MTYKLARHFLGASAEDLVDLFCQIAGEDDGLRTAIQCEFVPTSRFADNTRNSFIAIHRRRH